MNIAIVGGQCAGKTTAAEALPEYFTVVKFAEPLYNMNAALGVSKNSGFMQDGFDIVKKYFGVEFFALRFLEKYKHHDNLVCDDVRCMMEFVMLKALDWDTIFIDADKDTRHLRARDLRLDFLDTPSSESGVYDVGALCDVKIKNGEFTTLRAFQASLKCIFEKWLK